MSFVIKIETVVELEKEGLEKLIQDEAERYLKHTMSAKSIELVFLKSVMYLEDLMSQVNEKIHTTKRNIGLYEHIEYFRLFKGEDLKLNFELLHQVREFRNNIAHKLEYNIEENGDFFRMIGAEYNSSLDSKKNALAIFFKDLIHGPLFIKIGMENSDDFIVYSRR